MNRTHSRSVSSRPSLLSVTLGALALFLVPAAAGAQTSLADTISGCGGVEPVTTIEADTSDYKDALDVIAPGQRLLLAAGTYSAGLPVNSIHGAANQCIVIEGPATGPAAVFTARNCCNTVSVRDSSYVIIRNLELDGSTGVGDAVKAEFNSTSSHHVMLENLYVHDHDSDQQIVGINTKSIVWNWVVRHNRIDGAGTGIYFGNSNGAGEFVNGLIEYNVIQNTIGYNMQIKHQVGRNTGLGVPASGTTIIRHNVFSKGPSSSTGDSARPNLLVGHWPLSGDGVDDVYQIYGNLFYQNPGEALFQGEGNIAFHDNLMVNDSIPSLFPALAIRPHNDVPKDVELFHNTVVAAGVGVAVVGGDPTATQNVRANAVFSPVAITATTATNNVTDAYGSASNYLVNPTASIGAGLDLYPLANALSGSVVDLSDVAGFLDSNRDFNGTFRSGTFRGAYSGEGTNPGWALALDLKPDVEPLPADLSITKTNHQLVSVPGATTTFAIVATNTGPGNATGAVVADDFDVAIYDIPNIAWTCAPGAGGGAATTCPASGAGAALVAGVTVNIDSGDSVTFSVDAPVLGTVTGLLSNTATIALPAGVTDPVLANNSATDIDGVPGACGFASDLELYEQVIDFVESHTVCNWLAAGSNYAVHSPGNLNFLAGSGVALKNGFSVLSGASFTVSIDASLAPP